MAAQLSAARASNGTQHELSLGRIPTPGAGCDLQCWAQCWGLTTVAASSWGVYCSTLSVRFGLSSSSSPNIAATAAFCTTMQRPMKLKARKELESD